MHMHNHPSTNTTHSPIMGAQVSQEELDAEVKRDTFRGFTNLAVLDADMYMDLNYFRWLKLTPEVGKTYEFERGVPLTAFVHPILMPKECRAAGCARVRVARGTATLMYTSHAGGAVEAMSCTIVALVPPAEVEAMVSAPSLTIVDAQHTTRWFAAGLLHREDGPAQYSEDGTTQLFYRHGELHRDEDLPACIRPGQRYFYKHNQLHRDGDGPAVITATRQEWYVRGQLHRPDGKPAIILLTGTQDVTPGALEYWEHGKRHRVDGPATTIQEGTHELDGGNGLGPILPQWYFEGKLHRVGGPAFKNKYYRHGVLHRDDGGPAVVENGRSEWYRDGVLHRDDGPAVIIEGFCGREEWYQNGVLHRTGGPARTFKTSGLEEWFSHGKLHRDAADGPARTCARFREYFQDGLMHLEDGDRPAQEQWDLDTGICFRAWYVRGVLQRQDTVPEDARYVAPNGDQTFYVAPGVIGRKDGLPAFVGADGTKKWYLDGKPGRDGNLWTMEYGNGVKAWQNASGAVVRTDPAWAAFVKVS